ncbi:hypothetical protein D3C87_1469910 [compost metagenome]
MASSASVVGIARRRPRTGSASGAGPPSPDRMASSSAQQRTLAAMGPMESRLADSGSTPAMDTRQALGLKPVRPHSAAGMRTEPPVSDPIPATAMPSATDTAAPEDEPPGMRPVARS